MKFTENQIKYLKAKQLFFARLGQKNFIAPIFDGFIDILLELDKRQ